MFVFLHVNEHDIVVSWSKARDRSKQKGLENEPDIMTNKDDFLFLRDDCCVLLGVSSSNFDQI